MADQKEMQQLLNQLETFINGIPGSVYWKDKNGVYLGCNDVVIKKGNLKSKNDIVGKTDYDVWPEHADDLRKTDLEVISKRKTIETEETVVLQNGERLYFSSVKRPVIDENGNVIGVIGNSLDITELKQAKQKAEAASLAKTQFLALMSHELRIPLTGIISTANMLAEGNVTSEEAKEFGKIIEHSGNYLLTTIDNFLAFAKLEANKFELIFTPIHLQELIEEIVCILDAAAKEKKLKIHIQFKPTPPPKIMSDPRVLRHVITNLISNAIKYTEKGEIIVNVKNLQQTAESIELEISVKDTGIGIPANKIDYIFDRFTQIENTYTRKISRCGTGLGLSIVKKLVKLLNTQIQVVSELNVGSKFFFVSHFALAKDGDNQKIGNPHAKSIIS